jgi:hypothetical protein
MLEEVGLQHYTAADAEALAHLLDVYPDAHAEDGPLYSAERYRKQLARHMPRAGWELVAATVY